MKKLCEQAALYFYGELDPAQAAQFKAHLPSCPACQKELAFLEKMQAALVPPAAPQAVVERVLQRPQVVSFWRRWYKPVLTGALLLSLAVGGFIGRISWQNSSEYTPQWLAYVSDDLDEEYNNFLTDFETFENEF